MLEIGELRTVLSPSADVFLGLFYGIFSAFRRFGLAVLSKIAIAGIREGGVSLCINASFLPLLLINGQTIFTTFCNKHFNLKTHP